MIRVLITGANSYVGTNVKDWLMKNPKNYYVETLDMKNPDWIDFDFSKFDVVYHVAGIAHVSSKKSLKDLYYKVNRDLAIQTAEVAKKSGVKHFIFMSSMIVYSSKESKIDKNTVPHPDNFYGDSKLQAELGLKKLEDNDFNISVIRPPMIYGKNSKGNFPKLINLSKKIFVFPKFNNIRSSLFIDNLCCFIENVISNKKYGILFPQNGEYYSTSKVILLSSSFFGKKIWFTSLFNPLINVFRKKISIVRKVFGDFYYDYELSKYDFEYQKINLNDSVIKTIGI